MLSFARVFLVLSLSGLLILVGCSSQPQPREDARVLDQASSERVRDLLAEAQRSESPERDVYTLQAAELLVALGESLWARSLLESVDPDVLNSTDYVDYTMLFSQLAIDNDDFFLAQRILTNPRIEQQWRSLPEESVAVLRKRRAELFGLLGENLNSVLEYIALTPILRDQAAQANNDALWQNLMAIPALQLQQLVQADDQRIRDSQILRGWIELAVLSKNDAADIERQQAMIDDWMARRADHPASINPPSDLQLLRQLVEEQPSQVALLLPLNGDYEQAGRAVRDGFLAAYYRAKARGSHTPQVRIFDTNQAEFDQVYDLAVQDGAELIIGPLRPEDLEQLQLRPELPVPTLALNYAPTRFPLPPQLFQFSFEVEDEARQVANRAWLEGHRYALVLVPQSRRGERNARAFTETWEALGGTVVNQSYYADQQDYSGVVESALLVDKSKERARDLRRLLGGDIKFESSRRRQDVDFVFMVADPGAGQLLKPTLAFHYAGDVPVYSTSTVFSATETLNASRDLNGVRFITLPWYFETSQVKDAIVQHAEPGPSYVRLYAMGVDAYRLYPRLKQLELVKGARFYGHTGTLALGEERKLQREQVWAQIVNGKAIPLPTVVTEADVD